MACEIRIEQYKGVVVNLLKSDPKKFTKFDNIVEFIFDGPLTDEEKKLAAFNMAHIYVGLNSKKPEKFEIGKALEIIRSANALESTEEFINIVKDLYNFKKTPKVNENTILDQIRNLESVSVIKEGDFKNILQNIKNYLNTTTFESNDAREKLMNQFKDEMFSIIDSLNYKTPFKGMITAYFQQFTARTPYIYMGDIAMRAGLDNFYITLSNNQIVEAVSVNGKYYTINDDGSLSNQPLNEEDIIDRKSSRQRDDRKTNDGKQIISGDVFSSGLIMRAIHSADQKELDGYFAAMKNPSNDIIVKAVRLSGAGDARIRRVHDLANENPNERTLLNRNHETWENEDQVALLSSNPEAKIMTVSRPKASEHAYALMGQIRGTNIKFLIYSLDNYVFVSADNTTERVDFTNPRHQELIRQASVKKSTETGSGGAIEELSNTDIVNLANAQKNFQAFKDKYGSDILKAFEDRSLNSVDITNEFNKHFQFVSVKDTPIYDAIPKVMEQELHGVQFGQFKVITLDDEGNQIGEEESMKLPFIYTKVVDQIFEGEYQISYRLNPVLGKNQRIVYKKQQYTEEAFANEVLESDTIIKRHFQNEDIRLAQDLRNNVPAQNRVSTNNFFLYPGKSGRYNYRIVEPRNALSNGEVFAKFVTGITSALTAADKRDRISFFEKNIQPFKLVRASGTKGNVLRVTMDVNSDGQLVLQIRGFNEEYRSIITDENKRDFDFVIDEKKLITLAKALRGEGELVNKVKEEFKGLKGYDLTTEEGIEKFYSQVYVFANSPSATDNIKKLVANIDKALDDFSNQLMSQVIDKLQSQTSSTPEFMEALKRDFTYSGKFLPEKILLNRDEIGRRVPRIEISTKNQADRETRAKTMNGFLMKTTPKTVQIISKTSNEVSPESTPTIDKVGPVNVTETEKPADPKPSVKPDQPGDDIIDDVDRLSLVDNVVEAATDKDIATQSQWLSQNLPQFGLDLEHLGDVIDLAKLDGHALGAFKNKVIYLNAQLTGKGTLYHESFHGVFRYLMTEARRKELIDAVLSDKKHASKFTREALVAFGNKRNFNLDLDKLAKLQAEEILADGFQNYMLDKTKPKGLLAQFFEILKKILNFFKQNKDVIDQEFGNIRSGYYRTATIQSDIFNGEVAYELVPSLIVTSKEEGQYKRYSQQTLSVLEQKDLINMITAIMLEKNLTNTDETKETIDELFNHAISKALNEVYNIELLKKQHPELADEIQKELGPLYSNYNFVMGGRMKGMTISDINISGDSKYDGQTRENKITLIDNTQIDNTLGQHSLEVLKKLVLEDYKKKNTIQIERPEGLVDQEKIEELTDRDPLREDDPEEDTKDEVQSDSDFESGLGEYDRIDSNVGQVRRFLSTIRRDYVHPKLGIKLPKVVDGESLFIGLMKITSNISSSDIISVVKRKIDRMVEDGYTGFAEDLQAFYNKLQKEVTFDKNGRPKLNTQVYNMLIDAFHGIELNYVMTLLETPKEITEKMSAQEVMELASKKTKFSVRDSVAESDNKTKLNSLVSGMAAKHADAASTEEYATAVKNLFSLITTVSSPETKDLFGGSKDVIKNTVALENMAEGISKNMTALGLNIPKSLIKLSLMSINTIDNGQPMVLSKEMVDFYNDEELFVNEKRYLGKDFFKNLGEILKKTITGRDPKTNKPLPNLKFKEYLDEPNEKKQAPELKIFYPALRQACSYIVKYDPTQLPSVIRNAEGKPIYRYAKWNPLSTMAQEIRKRGLKNALSFDPYFDDFLRDFIADSFIFGDTINNKETDRSKKMNLFIENLQIVMFGGIQHKDGDIFKDGKTFKGADERALYATSILQFMKRTEIKDSKGNTITTYLRPFHQIESTNSNFLVTGFYEQFSTKEQPRVKIEKYGQKYLKITENLEGKVKQEYQRIKREWARRKELADDYNEGRKNRLVRKYNAELDANGNAVVGGNDPLQSKLKAYKFKALEDFFKNNKDLNDDLITAATTEALDYDQLPDEIKKALMSSLEKYAISEFESHLVKLEKAGLIEKKTEFQNTASKPETYYESEYIPSEYTKNYTSTPVVDSYAGKPVFTKEKVMTREQKNHVENLLFDFFCNHWVNAMSVNELFDGDVAMNVNNFVDYVKRNKRFAAAGSNMKEGTHKVAYINTIVSYINENYPQYGPYNSIEEIVADTKVPDEIKDVLIKEFNVESNMRDIFDGQSISSIMHQMDMFETLGRMDTECQRILIKKNYSKLTQEEIDYLENHNIVMNSKKTITASRYQNHKQSESYIDRNDVSVLTEEARNNYEATQDVLNHLYSQIYDLRRERQDAIIAKRNGQTTDTDLTEIDQQIRDNVRMIHSFFEPMPHRKELHDLLNAMEFHQIDQVMDTTASKNATLLPLDLNNGRRDEFGYHDLSLSALEVNNDGKYLQVETSGVKDAAAVSVQKKVLLPADIENFMQYAEVDAKRIGKPLTDSEKAAIKQLATALSDYQVSLTDGTKARLLYLQKIFRKDENFDIALLYDMIRENLIAQKAPSNVVQLFELDGDRKPIFSPNLPAIRNTLEFYFFKLYSKNVTDEKAFGFKNFHESSFGYTILEDTQTGEIITTDEIRRNPSLYRDAARYKSRPLSVTSTVENGVTKYFVEAIMPKPNFESAEEEKFWMDNISRQFGVRIPTEDKRSMVVIKVVDFVDSSKKNNVIVPHFVHLLAGSDFDIDSLFGQTFAYYKTLEGKFTKYGEYNAYPDEKIGKFLEFMEFMSQNEEVRDLIKEKKKETAKNGLQFAENGNVHQQILAMGFTQAEIDQIFERAQVKTDIRNIKGEVSNLYKLTEEATEEFADALSAIEINKKDYTAIEDSDALLEELSGYETELKDKLKEKREKYRKLGEFNHKRLSKLINAFHTVSARQEVFEQFNKNSQFKIPLTQKEYESNPAAKAMVSYVHQNKNLKATMDILSNEAVFNRLWINQRSSAKVFKDIMDLFNISFEEIANKGNGFSIDYAVGSKVENSMNKDGIGITASLNKFLALCSQYGMELNDDQIIWSFNQTKGKNFEHIVKKQFGQLNSDNERTIKLIGIILGVFADGAKEPIPAALNLNEVNSGVTLAMLGVGLSPEFAMAFNFIPTIKNSVKKVQSSRYAIASSESMQYKFLNSVLKDDIEEMADKETVDELYSAGLLEEGSFAGNLKINKINLVIDFQAKNLDAKKLKNNTLTTSDIGFNVSSTKTTKPLSPKAQEVILSKLYCDQAAQTWLIRKASAVTNFFKSLNPSTAAFDKITSGMEEVLGSFDESSESQSKLFTKDSLKKLLAKDQVWGVFDEMAKDLNKQASLLFLERTPFFGPLTKLFKGQFENQKTVANALASFIAVKRLLLTQPGSRITENMSPAAKERIMQDDANLTKTFTPEFWFTNDLNTKLQKMLEKYPDNEFLKMLLVSFNNERTANVKTESGTLVTSRERFLKIFGKEKIKGEKGESIMNSALYLYNRESMFVKELFYHELARTGMLSKKGSFLQYLPVQLLSGVSKQIDSFVDVLKKSYDTERNTLDIDVFKQEISKFMNFKSEKEITEFLDEMFLQIAYAATLEKNNSKIKSPDILSVFLGSSTANASGPVQKMKFGREVSREEKQKAINNIISHVFGKSFPVGQNVQLKSENFADGITINLSTLNLAGANDEVMKSIGSKLKIYKNRMTGKFMFPPLYKIGGKIYMLQGVDASISNNSIGMTMLDSLSSGQTELQLQGFIARYIPVSDQYGSTAASPTAFTKEQSELYNQYLTKKKDIVLAPSAAVTAKVIEEKKQEITTQPSTGIEREYTPENITSLKSNEVFVFGSNTEGRHGAGAALIAKNKFGAVQGQAEGLQGKSYAIITKDLSKGERSVPLNKIAEGINKLADFAEDNPDTKFYVTKIGSSLAGYTIDEIKEQFRKVNEEGAIPNNVILPKEFEVRTTQPVAQTVTQQQTTTKESKNEIEKLQKELADKELKLYQLQESRTIQEETAEYNPYLVIAEFLPKIKPESALKETGVKVGTKKDINPTLLSKTGVSVERAAEILSVKLNELGLNELSEDLIRDEIINILQLGKQEYKKQNAVLKQSTQISELVSEIASLKSEIRKLAIAKPGTSQDRIITVAHFKITVKPDGSMFYDNGKEVTDDTTKNKVLVNMEFEDKTLRVSEYNNARYFVLSDNRIIKAEKTDLGKETITDKRLKEIILEKAVLHKFKC